MTRIPGESGEGEAEGPYIVLQLFSGYSVAREDGSDAHLIGLSCADEDEAGSWARSMNAAYRLGASHAQAAFAGERAQLNATIEMLRKELDAIAMVKP